MSSPDEATPRHDGDSAATSLANREDTTTLATSELEGWFTALQDVARTLTLIREALGDPPEDLYEVVAGLEEKAWNLAARLDEVTEHD